MLLLAHAFHIHTALYRFDVEQLILSVEADARDTLAWLANVHMIPRESQASSPTVPLKTLYFNTRWMSLMVYCQDGFSELPSSRNPIS